MPSATMWSIGILVLALVPGAAGAAIKKLAHISDRTMSPEDLIITPAIAQFLRGGKPTCDDMGSVVCTQNDITVREAKSSDGRWERSLQFGSECATESTVVCKADKACGNSCAAACPCDIDTSVGPHSKLSYEKTLIEQLAPWCSNADSRVLMLGLGGGFLPQYLLHHCPGMTIDAVELSGDVISMARSFFGLGESEQKFGARLAVEQGDALSVVKERKRAASKHYDAVMVDCFMSGGEVPPSCRSRDFAENVKDVLKPAGVLLQNIWHYSAMRPHVQKEFEETKVIYSEVFDGSLDDIAVPMPAGKPEWVDILRATKRQA